jgi:tRNA A37 threonylcarbamoyladenosine synthetase subunit TsaC/SUA5/YrdC
MTKQKTVGIRIPDNKICLTLVKELGHPIISTSVYKPDESLYNDPSEIEERF